MSVAYLDVSMILTAVDKVMVVVLVESSMKKLWLHLTMQFDSYEGCL